MMSFAEFESLPPQPGKDELLDGEHFHLPPAFRDHMHIVHRIFEMLVAIIGAPGEPRRVWMETGFKIGERSWLVPDVSVIHPGQPGSKYFEGAPAVAIEVISEANTAAEIERKRRIYLANGAQEVWVIFPETQSGFIYRPDGPEEVRAEFRSRTLPGVRVDLSELFE